MSVSKLFIVLGSMNGLLAVSLGAFGAHALKSRLDAGMLSVYRTAVEYHFYHAPATIGVRDPLLHVPGPGWARGASSASRERLLAFLSSMDFRLVEINGRADRTSLGNSKRASEW